MQKIVLAITLVLVSLISSGAQAAPEMPCVKEICVGDGLDKLQGIAWQAIKNPAVRLKNMGSSEIKRRAKTYKGFSENEMPDYVILREFDREVLGNLSEIKAACEANELMGSYLSDGGNITKVKISLMPKNSAGDMVWRVTNIMRLFDGIETREQLNQLQQDLSKRYGKFAGLRKPGEGGFMFLPTGTRSGMSLYVVDVESSRNFGKHPLCDPPKKISID